MIARASVLVVDDEKRDNRSYCRLLRQAGYSTRSAVNAAQALSAIEEQLFDVVVLDMFLPMHLYGRLDFGGIEVLRRIKQRDETTQVIAVTGFSSRELAAEAMLGGAIDYITKDLDIIERLLNSVRLAAHQAHERRTLDLDGDDNEVTLATPSNIIANSLVMRQLFRQAQQFANNDDPVLITGEAGVGKEQIARILHLNSRYAASDRFRVVGCLTLTAGLPELWGTKEQPGGLCAEADGGSLVLKNIDLLPFNHQKKLVSFIEQKQYSPVGASDCVSCDIRIITTATNNVEQLAERGVFWRPLYDLIAPQTLHVPPLRERSQEDVMALAGHLLKYYDIADGLTNAAIRRLAGFDYARENLRELTAMLRAAAQEAKGAFIDVKHLPPLPVDPAPATPSGTKSATLRLPRNLNEDEQEEVNHLRDLIRVTRRRMRQLEVRVAELGKQADVSMLNEIEDLRLQITSMERQVKEITGV